MSQTLTKSQYLSEQLKQELASGHIAPEDKFFSIPQVSDKFQVSPATADKVVSGLVREGYLTAQRGKGYYVARRPVASDLNPVFRSVVATKKILLANRFDLEAPSASVLEGIQDACGSGGYRCEVISMTADNLLEIGNEKEVAGLMFCSTVRDRPLPWIDKPKICLGHWADVDDGVISYVADAEQAGIETVRHLCGLGHRRIALLAAGTRGIAGAFVSQMIAGLQRGFQMYGLEWSDDLVHVDLETSDREQARRFVSTYREKGITAAFVPPWATLSILMQELRREGLDVPGDLSLVGYGEHPDLTRLLEPRITRLDIHLRDIARKATERIIAYDQGGQALPETRFVTFPVELLPGGSTRSLYWSRHVAGAGEPLNSMAGQSEV